MWGMNSYAIAARYGIAVFAWLKIATVFNFKHQTLNL